MPPRASQSFLLLCIIATFAAGCERVPDAAPVAATTEVVTSKSGVEQVAVPAGSFVMGTAKGEAEEGPPHSVSIDAFLIDRYEVTQAEYEKYVIGNPSKFKDPKNPVERVRWMEAALFCNGRSSAEGLEPCYNEKTFECNFNASGYRLPTEAEWEYACRAGRVDDDAANAGGLLAEFAWFKDNSSDRTHQVGLKKPNAWGLYDMNGNAGEWCQDVYDGKFYERPATANPCNPTGGPMRALRGGSWNSATARCRATSRSGEAPGSFADACFARPDIGFRCVRRATAANGGAKVATATHANAP